MHISQPWTTGAAKITPLADVPSATEALARHAKARSVDARRRIDKAIRELRRQQSPINVNAVARTAGVTRQTIYRHKDLLARIRACAALSPVTATATADTGQRETSIVAALRQQLSTLRSQHRTQIAELTATIRERDNALAAAHGEIHRLTIQTPARVPTGPVSPPSR